MGVSAGLPASTPDADPDEAVTAKDAPPGGVWLRLERSAFYPTAGGQSHDTGIIGHWRVEDAREVAGQVWHRLAGDAADAALLAEAEAAVAAGRPLDCRIDWERRFRHMQRHTAEHLLAQAFARTGSGFHTRAVSMRGPDCTIDLTGAPDEEALRAAEAEANRAARSALPVMAFEVEERHLGEYRLRRPTARTGVIRLVAIGDYDVVACGGTHLRSTAEALPIKVVGSESIKDSLTRVTFRAGSEASEDFAQRFEVTRSLTRLLSAPTEELLGRVEGALAENRELKRVVGELRAQAAVATAARLLSAATDEGGIRLVSAVLTGSDADLLDQLVEALQSAPGVVTLLAAHTAGRIRLAFLTGPDTGVDVRPPLQSALAVIGGRGGGRHDRAQGAGDYRGEDGGEDAAERALAAARAALRAAAG